MLIYVFTTCCPGQHPTPMLREKTLEKLQILAGAAKYDVSCSSSGGRRRGTAEGLGSVTGNGICHTFTADGRCVSLLKILFTNHCIFDCAYCVSRRSNDVPRAAFTVEEVVALTLHFYRRNFIEGLFLSSGIFKNADHTTERLVRVARELRQRHGFNGYIHLKIIPGASPELVAEAGRWADRLSVNLEIPTEEHLKRVAPEKSFAAVEAPMKLVRDGIAAARYERERSARAPLFAPAGQSTQLVVGATPETDRTVLTVADDLYQRQGLRRVYYSGYVPVSADARVPRVAAALGREHRLYQADWLLRYYQFSVGEIVPETAPDLDTRLDPKLAWALRNPAFFPVDVNRAPPEWLLRVPGMGVTSAQRIVRARRLGRLRWEDLRRFGVVLKRARYFLDVPGFRDRLLERSPALVRLRLAEPPPAPQLSLFAA